MRLATSSLDRAVLEKILARTVPEGNTDGWRKIARFHLQCERYDLATRTIEALLKREADNAELKTQLEPGYRPSAKPPARQHTQRTEAPPRGRASTAWCIRCSQSSPPRTWRARPSRRSARCSDEYDAERPAASGSWRRSTRWSAKIGDGEVRETVGPIVKEIAEELGIDTRPRMAAFVRTWATTRPQARGAGGPGRQRLAGGRRLGATRQAAHGPVRWCGSRQTDLRLLREPQTSSQRTQMLPAFQSEEGGRACRWWPGCLRQHEAAAGQPEPQDREARPLTSWKCRAWPRSRRSATACSFRRSTIPTAAIRRSSRSTAPETTPEKQIDWWAGGHGRERRRAWARPRATATSSSPPPGPREHQEQYGYSAREHAAVLDCLRDACRRFSVDTDRVFLSGHSMGGDAAWDIGLAHPDLWAGVIPIVARVRPLLQLLLAERQLRAVLLRAAASWTAASRRQQRPRLDRYFVRGFNTTVVEYLGRGHEHFSDEILRLFDWMGRFRRDFFPRSSTVKTMRPLGQFLLVGRAGRLAAAAMVDPEQWANRNKAIRLRSPRPR